jgi:hypothetical protein
MSSLLKIGLALLLSTATIIVVMSANNRPDQPDPRQQEVQTYLLCRSGVYSQPLLIGTYVQARLPQNFQADMSKASFSNTPHYETDCRFNPDYGGYKPMPYPPNDLWCVKLISADPKAPKAIVVAQHQDIYNADWVVHEVTDPKTVLPAVGCPFPLP